MDSPYPMDAIENIIRRRGPPAYGRAAYCLKTRPKKPEYKRGAVMPIDQKPNRLAKEKSPYLLQHAYNPVDWFPWGAEAFARARKEDKPVFLSIGYSTCHWCHVMERESFEDREVAEALNRDFIAIKVDREERPDIDAVYMKACQSMTGSGGWPLTILMTAEQKPFFAATYLPRNSRNHTIGLLELLSTISREWKRDRGAFEAAGEKVYADLRSQSVASNPAGADRTLVESAVRQYQSSFDPVNGGFGPAPKFPAAHNLLFLLRYAMQENDPSCRQMVEKTLAQMYRGGIFDQIGGGFSRYSTDSKWLIPHFEKMLYDNALLTLAYVEAYQVEHQPVWERVIRKTLGYVLNELRDSGGGFYCAQDADSEGAEGKYYGFTPQEVERVLGDEQAGRLCEWFHITAKGNFHGNSIPNLLENSDWEEQNGDMDRICGELKDYRDQRTAPHKDDKILTAWNALMIAALARAAFVLGDPEYLRAAERAHAFLTQSLMDGSCLFVRWRDGEAAYPGQLDDYAFYAYALLTLYEATFEPEYLLKCVRISERMLRLFFDEHDGGFYFYSKEGETLIDRPKECYDGAMPSGNAIAAVVLGRLYRLTGDPKWQTAGQTQLRFLSGVIQGYPMAHSVSLLAFLEALYPSSELLCVTADDAVPSELTEFLSGHALSNFSVLVKTPDNAPRLEAAAPFTQDYPIPESGTAYYLCQNGVCTKPVFNFKDLRNFLAT